MYRSVHDFERNLRQVGETRQLHLQHLVLESSDHATQQNAELCAAIPPHNDGSARQPVLINLAMLIPVSSVIPCPPGLCLRQIDSRNASSRELDVCPTANDSPLERNQIEEETLPQGETPRSTFPTPSLDELAVGNSYVDVLDEILDEWMVQQVLASPDDLAHFSPGGRGEVPGLATTFNPMHDDIAQVQNELTCSGAFATSVLKEINIASITSQFYCSRAWALQLLQRHGWEPFVVIQKETNLAAIQQGHADDPDWVLSELRTSWGTTVSVEQDSDEFVIEVDGVQVRVLDEDYLSLCWNENVAELPTARATSQLSKSASSSTIAPSEDGMRSFADTD